MSIDVSIFYSWQSDLPNKVNRGFIEDVLKRACKRLEKDIPNLSLTVDQDARNTPVSQNIGEVLLKKINQCDIFIGDVSIINPTDVAERKCPNPNVMFEHGYAMRQLGENRIITFFNQAYGIFPDDLPFDLRFRTHIAYDLSENNAANKAPVRKALVERTVSDLLIMILDVIQARLLPGLDNLAHQAFTLAYEAACEANDTIVHPQPIQEAIGVDEQEFIGILDTLEYGGYVTLRRSLNHNLLPFSITDLGLLRLAELNISDFDATVRSLLDLIVNQGVNRSNDLADQLSFPSILVEAILRNLESQSLLTLAHFMNFSMISTVAPRLQRELGAN